MNPQLLEIRCLADVESATVSVGLPVGPRIGPGKRTKEKKEWFVLLGFLKTAIPNGTFELPIVVRNGRPPDEPDFVAAREESTVGLFEVTEATVEADQKEMTAFERSGKEMMMLGDFGGRFAGGGGWPGVVWATDIVGAIMRKRGKTIFRDSTSARHLLVYPNSNAAQLLFDEDDERKALEDLRAAVSKDAATLSHTANGCLVHVLGKHLLCFDTLGEMRVLPFKRRRGRRRKLR
jgi:hypothetical protein